MQSIIIDLYKIDLSKYLIYPNNFRMKFSVPDHCDVLQGAEGKKLVHQVVSHCSSNKASLNRQLVLSGLFMVSAGAIYCRTKVRLNFKNLLVRVEKSCWNGGDLMLFVEKIDGQKSIVLSYTPRQNVWSILVCMV